MFRVTEASRFEADTVKGSRFIADVIPIDGPEGAKAAIATIAAEFPDASHHCWAWRLADERQQSSDDGEPGGSAGRPILAQIVGHEVIDALVVVTRWFGGTKLGVGGLVRAYGGTAGQALDRAALEPYVPTVEFALDHSYEDGRHVDAALRRHEGETLDSDYGAAIRRRVRVPLAASEAFCADLLDASAGRIAPRRED